MSNIQEAKRLIKEAKYIVVISGAGISTPSGIPDIRSATGAMNNKDLIKKYKYDYETIVSHSFFMSNTYEFYRYYKNEMVFKNATPNIAHKYLANLESSHKVTIITQNIDGLHIKAGSSDVVEFHGSVLRNTCMKCGKKFSLDYVMKNEGVPHCDECHGIIKPDVVLFEEGIDEYAISHSLYALQKADLLIVIGSSLNVYPAAGLVRYFTGTNSILINRDPTPLDYLFKIIINDDIINVIKELENA